MRADQIRLSWALAFGAVTYVLSTDATACSCVPRQTLHHYAKAELVVIGEVISTNEADLATGVRNYVPRAIVRVEDVFNGQSVRTLAVEVRSDTCSIFLRKKDRVILFLDKTLQVDQCRGSTIMLSDEDLRNRLRMNDDEIRTYRAKLHALTNELYDLMPKKWWQFWR